MHLKTPGEVEAIRAAGRVVAVVLETMAQAVKPGITTGELDDLAAEVFRQEGAMAAFYQYKPPFSEQPYPRHTCISINDEVIHGIPGTRVIQEGDLVSLDAGALLDGWYADAARSVGVGRLGNEAHNLLLNGPKALQEGIKMAQVGKTIGDIGYAIQEFARKKAMVPVDNYAGHGIGRTIHEEPDVYNIGHRGEGLRLVPGMVFCIEPMLKVGSGMVYISAEDSWTVKTGDGHWAVHFEHTVAVTEQGPQILTVL